MKYFNSSLWKNTYYDTQKDPLNINQIYEIKDVRFWTKNSKTGRRDYKQANDPKKPGYCSSDELREFKLHYFNSPDWDISFDITLGNFLVGDLDLGTKSLEVFHEIIYITGLDNIVYEVNEKKGNLHFFAKFKNKIDKKSRKSFQENIRKKLVDYDVISIEQSSKIELALPKMRVFGSKDYCNNIFFYENESLTKLNNLKEIMNALDNSQVNIATKDLSSLRYQGSDNKASRVRKETFRHISENKVRDDLKYGPGSNKSEWYFKLASHTKNMFGGQDIATIWNFYEMIDLHGGNSSKYTAEIKNAWAKNKEFHQDKIIREILFVETAKKSEEFNFFDYEIDYLKIMIKTQLILKNKSYALDNKVEEIIELYRLLHAKLIVDKEKPGYKNSYINKQLKYSLAITEEWLEATFLKSTKTQRKNLEILIDLKLLNIVMFKTSKNGPLYECVWNHNNGKTTTYSKHYHLANIEQAYEDLSSKFNRSSNKSNYFDYLKIQASRRSLIKEPVKKSHLVYSGTAKVISSLHISKEFRKLGYRVKLSGLGKIVVDEKIYDSTLRRLNGNELTEYIKNFRIEKYTFSIFNKFGKSSKINIDDSKLLYLAHSKVFRKKSKKKNISNNMFTLNLNRKNLSRRLNFIQKIKNFKLDFKIDIVNLYRDTVINTVKENTKKNTTNSNSFYSYIYRNNSPTLSTTINNLYLRASP